MHTKQLPLESDSKTTALTAVTSLALITLRKVTGLSESDLRETTTFESIHLESLAITAFVSSLEVHFPELSKTFIFDCRNILDVANYLNKHHPEAIAKLTTASGQPARFTAEPVEKRPISPAAPLSESDSEWPEIVLENHHSQEAIAIIGMHGEFPNAHSLQEFWDNLYAGKDAISEIPSDRWALDGFFEAETDSRKSGLSYAKWGGFVDGVDQFDAQFFGISAREATQMDPQERMFLECAWHAMENAALLGERAENLKQGNNYNIGVFVGLTTNTYSLMTADHWRNGGKDIPAAVPWSAANRVSFTMNLSGPSLTVDTACSSSLVALHLACESLFKGECKAAITGGVNLYFHPAKYIQLCQLQMLSPTGRCHSFGKDGDGFVPGEGVGAIVLKPLSTALADGDKILGVIRGTAVNHCGRTNGYTVPDAQSQAQLIRTALDAFDVPPASITFVEAHGTGTKLGDPIEFSALTETLAGKSSEQPCGLGSVKSNIGHLESAAGIAGVIKVLLQLQHECIAPSLASSELNPALDMTGSRFFVPQKPMPWQPDPDTGLRRAGVSSFGAGGTNGHVIIEQAPPINPRFQVEKADPLVFPVSARTQTQLHELLQLLVDFVQSPQFNMQQNALHALAYVLQCGRRHHPFRFSTVASSVDEFVKNTTQYLRSAAAGVQIPPTATYINHVRPDEETEVSQPFQDQYVMAKQWCLGARVRWCDLWKETPILIDLPRYPFARERHWISTDAKALTLPGVPSKSVSASATSQTFQFSGQEYFLRDHQVGGSPILPAVAYVGYFQRIANNNGLPLPIELQDITWVNPFRPNPETGITSLHCETEAELGRLKLVFSSIDQQTLYCRGAVVPADTKPQETLAEVQARCHIPFEAQSCYPVFDSIGMVYGPTFRCMRSASVAEEKNEALVEVSLGQSSVEANGTLEPGMLDSILQSSFVLAVATGRAEMYQFIPYAVKALRIYRALPAQVWVHVIQRPQQHEQWRKFDFKIFTSDGECILDIEEFAFRALPVQPQSVTSSASTDMSLYQPFWIDSPLAIEQYNLGTTLIFDNTLGFYRALYEAAPANREKFWVAVQGSQFVIRDDHVIELDYKDTTHLDLLWRTFLASGHLPENLVFNFDPLISHDSLDISWETYAGLTETKKITDLLRSACKASPTPRFHIQVNCLSNSGKLDLGTAISGFLRPLHEEIPTISGRVVNVLASSDTQEANKYLIKELLAAPSFGVQEIQWERGKRSIRHLSTSVLANTTPDTQLVAGDLLVVTGGRGAIARVLVDCLSDTIGLKFALIGRSPADDETRDWINQLHGRGVLIEYWQCDCAQREALESTLSAIRSHFGNISAVLHCAGVLKDGFFLRQEKNDWDNVLKAKVLGALWLDELTCQDPLKWFAMCSGLAGVRGNVGQSIYGLANAWLNVFAEQRQYAQRPGHSLAIAWSLWNTDQGMQAPKAMLESYVKKGLQPITQTQGIAMFRQLLQAMPDSAIVVPIAGQPEAIASFLQTASDGTKLIPKEIEATTGITLDAIPQTTPASDLAHNLEQNVLVYLSQQLSNATGTPLHKIDPNISLEAFGLDSIIVMELNDTLGKQFPQMSKTVLFEARNLRSLALLLIAEHRDDAIKLTPPEPSVSEPTQVSISATGQASASLPEASQLYSTSTPTSLAPRTGDNIAIIGIAGRYPDASNLDELWQHLTCGDDLITEVSGRWTIASDFPQAKPLYAKWGGFIKDYDRFDPLFFGISPRDAERMDPQERLFLQVAWHTLEDAGYTPESLTGTRDHGSLRRRVGVIVGVMYGEYQMYSAAEDAHNIANSSYASIANRVSYCMDFDGPSFAVDSMCSSSLTSISLACDQLRAGRCDAVIAGGVNLSIHSHKYRMLCELNFASSDGRCRSFGEGGDGYVPGEGVGAVLLKRLEDAERDGDHIYAVIQGSDIGHGAKTSGYTVPNADAQAEVIEQAFARSGIDPKRLSYIEAHGTGTNLGDPIEIRGMTKALASSFDTTQLCPIGSIKSNIGHLESAAGIAALSKVLLQLQHEQLVPSIHADTLNKNIDFSKTPFYVQRELTEWSQSKDLPRVAAISSFGAGGANAHMVIEEYIVDQSAVSPIGNDEFILFSAKTYAQLNGMVQNFIAYLDREMIHADDGIASHVTRYKFTLHDVAMTMTHGRRHFNFRLAVTAKNFSQLRNRLHHYVSLCASEDPAHKQDLLAAQEIYYGDSGFQSASAEQAETILEPQAWVAGKSIPKTGEHWRKVPLPGYMFLRNRYWIDSEQLPVDTTTIVPKQVETPLTPSLILERVSRGEIPAEEARRQLLAMSANNLASAGLQRSEAQAQSVTR